MNITQLPTSIPTQNHHGQAQEHVGQQPVKREIVETEKQVSKEKVIETVDKMNDFIKTANTNLKFVFHDELSEYYVTVIDPLTNEVVKEIPSKKMLDMYSAMVKYMGILVDERV